MDFYMTTQGIWPGISLKQFFLSFQCLVWSTSCESSSPPAISDLMIHFFHHIILLVVQR